MSVTKDDIIKLGRLARISIPQDELQKRADNINGILQWIEQLNEVNTDAVEPLASVTGHALPLRDDVVTDGNKPDDVVHNVPESMSGFFVVPKVVE